MFRPGGACALSDAWRTRKPGKRHPLARAKLPMPGENFPAAGVRKCVHVRCWGAARAQYGRSRALSGYFRALLDKKVGSNDVGSENDGIAQIAARAQRVRGSGFVGRSSGVSRQKVGWLDVCSDKSNEMIGFAGKNVGWLDLF